MTTITPTLNIPQSRFYNLNKKFRAFVSGFCGEKTWVDESAIRARFWQFPKVNQGYLDTHAAKIDSNYANCMKK